MDLFETLKQFKQIEPDASYKETSKRAVLATLPREPLSFKKTLATFVETGLAFSLVAFFILLATGQFFGSETPYVSPIQLSVVNPDALHAEAQAIDMQIKLANLSYQESTTTISNSLTTSNTKAASKALIAPSVVSETSPDSESLAAATSTPSSTISIDQALEQLGE